MSHEGEGGAQDFEEDYEEDDDGKDENMKNMNFPDSSKPKKIKNEHYDVAYEVNDSGKNP